MSEQVEAVNKCMSFIPDEMDMNEGRKLMNLLYQTGIVPDYLDALDAAYADENGYDEDDDRVQFRSYFDFDEWWNMIKIDPQTGKITYLSLRREYSFDDDEDEESKPFDLPPIIEQLEMLEHIELWNCHLIPIELGKLSLLTNISLYRCHKNLFENIPEGLQLPLSTKSLIISFLDSDSDSYSSLSPFMKILPNSLSDLRFENATTREHTDEFLRILQEDDLNFSQSLTTLRIYKSKLNEDDLEQLLFESRSNFPNLRTLDVSRNEIKSLLGIEARIKRMVSSSSSSPSSSSSSSSSSIKLPNLCKLMLFSNRVCRIWSRRKRKPKSNDPKEIAAVLTLLNTFDSISNLGSYYNHYRNRMYEPDIEYLLRRNKVNMNFTTTTTTTATEEENTSGGNENTTISNRSLWPLNRSLWPLIFERAYKNSHEIYEFCPKTTQEVKNRQKCATGLFELVRNGPLFAEDHQRRCHDDSNQKKTTTTTTMITTTSTDCGSGNNNTTLKRKSTYSS